MPDAPALNNFANSDRAYTVWAITEYYHPNFSGAAIQAHRILSMLRGMQVGQSEYVGPETVRVLTVADQAAKELAGERRQLDGVQIDYLPVIGRRNWDWLPSPLAQLARNANQLLRDWSFQHAIRRALKSAQPNDIVQWYVVGDFTWFTIRFAQRRKLRSSIQISLVGADDPGSFRRSLLGVSTALKRACFHQADSIIGLSRALIESCRRAGVPMERVYRIPNGVDTSKFCPASRRRQQQLQMLSLDDRRYISFVGSAIHRKGIDVVIPAFIALAKDQPDIDLLILGPCDFSDRTRHPIEREQLIESLRQELKSSQLESRVHWLGQVDNVHHYLQVSDLFFFPTRREGLPNALAEALACGVPALCSSLPGITTDLVTDGVEGRLVEGHDAADYARVLRELFESPESLQRMSQAACRRIRNEFALPKIAIRYARHYDELRQRQSESTATTALLDKRF